MIREIAVIVFTVLALSLSIAAVLYQRMQLKNTYQQLDAMLEAAIKGDFKEKNYDETMLSKTMVKFKRFFTASQLSIEQVGEEKQAIKSLITDIAHQTKTPITNILLYLELLMEDEQLCKESKSNIAQIKIQSEKLDFLLQALVKTSRLETGIITVKPEYGSLNQAVLQAAAQVRSKASQKGIELQETITREYKAAFDLKWTVEAIYNVLDNAVKYTQPGGSVTIRMQEYEMFIRLDISDTGIGIPEDEINQIFQRFYRGREAAQKEGVGIGLYLTRKILTQEGGYLKVASKPGRGTTFSLFFIKEMPANEY